MRDGAKAASSAFVACVRIQTVNSMPHAFNRVVVPSPYKHIFTTSMFFGNISAAAIERVSKLMILSFTAADAGSTRDSTGTSKDDPKNNRNNLDATSASSKFTIGRFVSQVHRRLSKSSPRFATS